MTSKFLLGGGCVLTLGAKTSNFARADLLIEDGRVTEVGPELRARDAERVDASDTIVMPGFVDTHRHAWTSLFRNVGEPTAGEGVHQRPDDVYAATLISLLGAIEAGITTVVDWSDLDLDDASADASLQAHADAGLRTVLVHVPGERSRAGGDAGTRALLTRLRGAAGSSTRIALGSDGLGAAGLEHVADDWAIARELGTRIFTHARSGPGVVAGLAARGLLGEDVTLVHCSQLDTADLDAVGRSGASVSLSPWSEMAGGLGSPPIQQLIDRGIRLGLAVDDERMAPGDLFAQMRSAISLQHATAFDLKLAGKAGVPRLMSTRDVIRYATVRGAQVAGWGRETGSLEPGMQADVILLRTDRPNIFPINDPIGAVVWGMDTSNVDWVFVAGKPLMRGGVLQADVEQARTLATTAQHRVAVAAGLAVGTAPGS